MSRERGSAPFVVAIGETMVALVAEDTGHIRLIPTGGVDAANAAAYLNAGAVALGAGTSVVNPAWAREGRYELFEQAAADFLRSLGDMKGAT